MVPSAPILNHYSQMICLQAVMVQICIIWLSAIHFSCIKLLMVAQLCGLKFSWKHNYIVSFFFSRWRYSLKALLRCFVESCTKRKIAFNPDVFALWSKRSRTVPIQMLTFALIFHQIAVKSHLERELHKTCRGTKINSNGASMILRMRFKAVCKTDWSLHGKASQSVFSACHRRMLWTNVSNI